MNISVDTWSGKFTGRVEGYVIKELVQDGSGLLESNEANIVSVQDALGRLCDVLAQKGVLDAQDITYVARGIVYEEAELYDD